MARTSAFLRWVRILTTASTLSATQVGQAAAPVLDHLFPAAVQAGTTNTVTAIGKFDPWPPAIWSDPAGLSFEPTTNAGVFTVIVAPDAPAGPRFVRAFNAEGASAPRFLLVSKAPQIAETEPNGAFNSPQVPGSTPFEINGRLEKNGDVDSYRVHVGKGQTLVAWVEAYTLMSPLDPVLRLVDSRGVQIAWNHDDGRSLDPFLAWTAPDTGDYVLQVFGFAYPADSDIRFSGNARCVYRLLATTGPVLHHTLPLGVQRGQSTTVQPVGWNLGTSLRNPIVFDGSLIPPWERRVALPLPEGMAVLDLPVGEGPEALEAEPNSKASEANAIPIPGAMTGDLNAAGDVDRFAFDAKKGEPLVFEVQATRLGFPLDAWLAVEDRTGAELARNDDDNGADPRLEWSAPEDGRFTVAVGNLLQRGGENQVYRLSVQRPRRELLATLPANALTLAPGATNEVKVTLGRKGGYDSKLRVEIADLPEGVQVEPLDLDGKAGEAVLKLVAAASAPPFNGPIRIRVRDLDGGTELLASMELVSAGENNGVPQGFRRLALESISRIWLTVTPPPAAPEAKPAETK